MRHLCWILIAFLALVVGCKKDEDATLPALTTVAATNITANSAQTGGNITNDGGAPITKRGVCWATHANPTVSDSITSNGTGSGAFSSPLSDLWSNTTYYVRAYAINSTGTAYGNEISFTTEKGAPAVSTNPITDIAPLTAKSGGNITNDGGAAVTARGVCWATTPLPTIDNFKTSDGSGTGAFTSTLSPLASQTTYYVRAYATNSYGTAYGNQQSFSASAANTVTDYDGNVYAYVEIGTQKWMASNLKTTHYQNGDPIINGLTNYNWNTDANGMITVTTGAYTFPNADENNNALHGKYYNIYAVNDSRGICPAGWHVPSDDEWKILEVYLGMSQDEADEPKDPNYINFRGNIGTKLLEGGSSGLNLQKSGYLLITTASSYILFNEVGAYWSSTPFFTDPGFETNLARQFNVGNDPAPIYKERRGTQTPMCVRCISN